MEDERGAGGQSDSGGVSEPPLSGKLDNESVAERMVSDDQAEEVFEEGDGEEIMVEVVGSDVYVDGVSGNGEGDCEMIEAGDLEGGVVEKNENSTDMLREGLSESRVDKHGVTKEVDTSLSICIGVQAEKVSSLPVGGTGVVDDEVWNPGIKTGDGLSTGMSLGVTPAEVAGISPTDTSEEKEAKGETVIKDISNLVTSESSDRPLEAISDKKADLAEGKRTLPPNDNSTGCDRVAVCSVRSDGETKETHAGNDGVTGQVDSVNASDGGELPDSDTLKDGSIMAAVECLSTDGDSGIQGKSVLENYVCEKVVSVAESKDSISKPNAPNEVPDDHEKDVGAAEIEDSIPKPDAPTDVLDESQNRLDDLPGAKLVPNDQTDGASHAGNDECSKTEDDAEANKTQNEVIISTPIQFADGGDAVEVNKDDLLNVVEENKHKKTSMSGSTDEDIVQLDSGVFSDQSIISTTVGAVTGDQNVVIPLVKDVDGGGYGEKGMEIDSENLGKSLANHGSAEVPAQYDSAENMPLPEEGPCLEVETPDAMMTEDPVPCHDPNSEGVASALGDCGSPPSTKEVVALQVTEASSHEVGKLEKARMMPNEVSTVAANSDTAQVIIIPEGNGNTELLLSSTDILLDEGRNENSDELHGSRKGDEMHRASNGFYVAEALEGHMSEAKPMEVEEERDSDQTYHAGQDIDAETATERPSSEIDKSNMSNLGRVKYAGSLRMKQSGYLTPSEEEGCFTPSDLVWGKVRSHPWWPGQIFDPENASEKAVKHYKKDSYLVAYFGDQTFAWNDSSALKPFRSYFSQIEKQSNSESFHNAVNCALEEVERRVQLGLSCSCIPKDDYAKIETQVLENTGIREESSQRYGVDHSSCASHFEPSELLEFIKTAAPCASSGADRLDLVIARAQLAAFCSYEGYRPPIEFPPSGELLEIDEDTEQISDEAAGSHKARRIPKEGAQSRKERSLMELMGDGEYYPYAEDESASLYTGKKRKTLDPLAEGSDKSVSFSAAKVPALTSQAPKPSFKIGECIRRVANQLTGSTSLVKSSNDEMAVDGSPIVYQPSEKQNVVVSAESLSVSEMLSQLELLAQNPKRRHYAQNQIRAFFMGFRSSTALSRRGRKKKSEQAIGGSAEEFEFDDVNDSYWTDRIVQNYSAEQLLNERINGAGSLQMVPYNVEKTGKPGRKPHSRKRFSIENSPTSAPEFDENAKRIKQESSPAELILSFGERNRLPSEINLNKMFRRFGPLMESETQVDHESGSAKVIFKRGSDAEVARNSAEKFSIFGPLVVSYQIGYSPVISVKILPVSLPQSQEEATLML